MSDSKYVPTAFIVLLSMILFQGAYPSGLGAQEKVLMVSSDTTMLATRDKLKTLPTINAMSLKVSEMEKVIKTTHTCQVAQTQSICDQTAEDLAAVQQTADFKMAAANAGYSTADSDVVPLTF